MAKKSPKALHKNIQSAQEILKSLGFDKPQYSERSAYCLLALLGLTPDKSWSEASSELVGINPMLDFAASAYGRHYEIGSRESFRRRTMHQFVAAGLALYNPDNPSRKRNSSQTAYQICPQALNLLRLYGSDAWETSLADYLIAQPGLQERYAKERQQTKIAVKLADGKILSLSPGAHSELIRQIIEEFAPRFAKGSELVYAGDTADKHAYFDAELLASLGVVLDPHGKMPDVIFYYREKNWLLLVEAFDSHGPVDGKRYEELASLLANSIAPLVYVTACLNKKALRKAISDVAWETEVWVADAPSHLIHFNGERFLGPYPSQNA